MTPRPTEKTSRRSTPTLFPAKPETRRTWRILAGIAVVLMGVSVAADVNMPAGGTFLGVSILMAVWTSRASLVSLFDEHFEMKLGPIAPTKRVKYRDLQKLEFPNQKTAKLTYLCGGKSTALKIPLHAFSADARKKLIGRLEVEIAAAG